MTSVKMGRSIQALIDVSPLTRRAEDRTGLARVAWELFAALSRREDLDVRTCAWGSLAASRTLRIIDSESPQVRAVTTTPGVAETLYGQYILSGEPRGSSPLSRITARLVGQVINVVRDPLRGVPIGDFDVVHSTYPRFPRAVRAARVAKVITVHDLIPLRRPLNETGRTQRAITRRIIDSIRPEDHVVCVSEATRADFLAHKRHPADRVFVIHNGVNHSVFKPVRDAAALKRVRERFGLGDAPFVMTMSSLAAHKNLRVVIEAWRAVSRSSRGRLVIAGGKSSSVAAIRSQLGVAEEDSSVAVTGFVTDGEFQALASGCNAFLFPSLHEGFGLPVLEALAVGAPVIAANATSLPEVIGNDGTLLDPLDVSAWQDAIAAAVALAPRDTPCETSITRAARFSWDEAAARYTEVYRRAVDEVRGHYKT